MKQLITQSDPDIGIQSHLSTFGEHVAGVFNGRIAPYVKSNITYGQ